MNNNRDMFVFSPDDIESGDEIRENLDANADVKSTIANKDIDGNRVEKKEPEIQASLNDSFQSVPHTRSEKEEKYILYRKLPFVGRRMGFFDWVERNSTAVLITSLFFIVGFIVLVSWRIDLLTVQFIDGVFIEMPQEEKPEPPKPTETPDQKKQELEYEKMMNVKNQKADANAKLDAGLKDDRTTKFDDVLREAQEVQDKMDANKAAYERGLEEAGQIGRKSSSNGASSSDPKSKEGEGQKEERIPTISKKGNVTVEYNLPGRYATYLPIPAYKCQEGGKVVINIVVDRNGDVLEVSVDSASSSRSTCITDMALDAAKKSRFDVNGSAQPKQKGTITYIFVAQ